MALFLRDRERTTHVFLGRQGLYFGQWRWAVYRLRRDQVRSSNSNQIPWISGVIAVWELSLGVSPDACSHVLLYTPGPTQPSYPLIHASVDPMLLDYLHYRSETPIDPPTRAPLLLGVSFSLYFLALSFVGARLFVNWKLGRLGREDALIAASSVCCPPPYRILNLTLRSPPFEN